VLSLGFDGRNASDTNELLRCIFTFGDGKINNGPRIFLYNPVLHSIGLRNDIEKEILQG